jgi:hypothetical protein
MLSNVINDIININKIPSSYIVEHVPAICLLRERLILSTVATPMEFCSLNYVLVQLKTCYLVNYFREIIPTKLNHMNYFKKFTMLPEVKC